MFGTIAHEAGYLSAIGVTDTKHPNTLPSYTMQIRNFRTPQDFLHTCAPILERDEAANNLMLGLAQDLIVHPPADPSQVLMYAFAEEVIHGNPLHGHVHAHGGEPYCFLFQSDARRGMVIAVTDQFPAERLPVIVACLRSMHPNIAGLLGQRDLVRHWAEMWTSHFELHFDQLLYTCTRVIPPAHKAAGRRRMATASDLRFLPEWLMSFAVESMTIAMTQEQAEKHAANRLADGAIQIWEDGAAVSMLMIIRPTKTGCMVGYVYTPPALRGRGYASALVAEATQEQLDRGKAFVALFTDEANPTSNKIYRALGYEQIEEFAHYWLHPEKS